jgi:hypothetical protein
VRAQIDALPEQLSAIEAEPASGAPSRKLVISDALRATVERLAREAVQ